MGSGIVDIVITISIKSGDSMAFERGGHICKYFININYIHQHIPNQVIFYCNRCYWYQTNLKKIEQLKQNSCLH